MTMALRRTLDRPYLAQHTASIERAAESPPRGLPKLMRWFEEHWFAEVPDKLHMPGVWRDYGEDAVGASALGAPRYADPFRRYIENSPFETDDDGCYVRPVHAAIARLTGRDPNAERAYHGRFLWTLALNGFDWRTVATSASIPYPVQPIYTEQVVRLLWQRFEPTPTIA